MTALNVFHEACERRAEGRCEARVAGVCRRRGDQAHHVVPRSRGVGWSGLHEPSNGLWVCSACHEWIHGHPRASKAFGLLKSRPLEVA